MGVDEIPASSVYNVRGILAAELRSPRQADKRVLGTSRDMCAIK